MIAPKINGQDMKEVYYDHVEDCGNWLSSFGSGKLEIRVFKPRNSKDCGYTITYDGVKVDSCGTGTDTKDGFASPQNSADQAMKFLKTLYKILHNVVPHIN